MIDEAPANPQERLVVQNVAVPLEVRRLFARESGAAAKRRLASAAVEVDFAYVQYQVDRIPVHDVPGVGAQLVLDLIDEARAAQQGNPLLASEDDAQQLVEPGKVIHVGVGDEDVRDAQQLAWG